MKKRKPFKFPRALLKIGECFAVVDWRTGKPTLKRRPKITYNGRHWIGHRLSHHLNNSKIPRTPPSALFGLILHSCDNRWCVNPRHLRIGTHQENQNDVSERYPEEKRKREAERRKKWFKNKNNLKKFRLAVKERWKRPGERERYKELFNRPELKEKRSKAQFKAWQDPKIRANRIAAARSPETRKKFQESWAKRRALKHEK